MKDEERKVKNICMQKVKGISMHEVGNLVYKFSVLICGS